MMTATYFGEITELDSRAVWYSDEEDEDEDEDDAGIFKNTPKMEHIVPLNYEKFRSNIQLNFNRTSSNKDFKFESCIISLSSSPHFNQKMKTINPEVGLLYGHFDSMGKAFVFPLKATSDPVGTPEKQLLWLTFDASNPLIVGYHVSFFVEALRKILYDEFKLDHTNQIVILSQQFAVSEHLEYLSNFKSTTASLKLPFVGQPMLPPSLIKNQFESSLFEQLTLTLEPAIVVCLPDPKKFWFERTKDWPSIPHLIIEHKLNDDNLEKTLIFT